MIRPSLPLRNSSALWSVRNNRATLGVAISDLRNQAARWELNIEDTGTGQPAGIESVIQMLDLLWKGPVPARR